MGKRQKTIGAEATRGAASRAAALARRPEIRALISIVSLRGGRAWIAGGAARDLLAGRPIVDVDAVLTVDLEETARELEREGAGRCVPLSRETPRVFRLARPGRDLDLVELTGATIERDLARRDFTANAIAFDLLERRWIDPFGGVRDLARSRLTMVAAENLAEDPLRALRAARLFATHGLLPDRETSLACRKAAPGLARVAPERIRAELGKLLEAPRAAPAVRWAARWEVLAPSLAIPQARARLAARRVRLLDSPRIVAGKTASRRRLRTAILLAVSGFAPKEAIAHLAARRFGREDAGEVGRLLALVDQARAIRLPRQQWEWIHDAGPAAQDASALLALLDPGRPPLAQALARKMRRAARRRALRVTGQDILRWLDLGPGPAVGRLLREVRIEILRGAVRSRKQARAWLSGIIPLT